MSEITTKQEGGKSAKIDQRNEIKVLEIELENLQKIMATNVEKVLQRDHNLEELISKAEVLKDKSSRFKKISAKVKHRLQWKNGKTAAILTGTAVITVGVIVLVILL